MGACASKFKDLKDIAGEGAAPPVPKEEVEASREVKLAEETVSRDDVPPPPAAADGETKSRSLGLLFKENEVEIGSAENNGKSLEEVKQEDATETTKQENGNVKPPEPVANAPGKDKTEEAPATDALKLTNPEKNETENVKSANGNVVVEVPQKTEDKLAETTQTEVLEKCEVYKPDKTLDTQKIEEQKQASDEEKKKIEEKLTETTNIEIEEKQFEVEKTEKVLAETPKVETEDKRVVESLKIESPVDNKLDDIAVTDKKPETPETKGEEQKQISDGEETKAGEEETNK